MLTLLILGLLFVFFFAFTFAAPVSTNATDPLTAASTAAAAHSDLRNERVSRKDAFENAGGMINEKRMRIPGSYGGEQDAGPGEEMVANYLGLKGMGGKVVRGLESEMGAGMENMEKVGKGSMPAVGGVEASMEGAMEVLEG